MTDLLRLVTQADRQRTLPTLSRLSANDIGNIWADVSAYIESQMASQKGVHVVGLGTFTFSQQKFDLGNKSTMIQRPIFILSGKLVHSLSLNQARPLAAAAQLPVVPLNYTAVSRESPFSRDTVEGCVRETLLLLVRTLASEQNVFLSFQGLGVLSFKNNKVQMKFRKDFINALDGTGSLLSAFKKRPGSSVSLMSTGLSRLHMNPNTLPKAHSPGAGNQPADRNGQCLSLDPDQQNVGGVSQQPELKSHQTPQPAKMNAVNPSEEANPKPQVELSDKALTVPPETLSNMEDPHGNKSCSGHSRAGQELCYLCMQRANSNVPVYLREQQQAEEKVQERLLLLKEQQKDKLFMEKEQAKLAEQREHAKEASAFNLHMSEKKNKMHFSLYPTSFIFPSRPLTPAPRLRQHQYMNELQSQIERKRQHEAQEKQSRVLSEHLDQVQLLQELAFLKTQQFRQRQEKTQHYRKALDAQVGDKKSTALPVCQPEDFHFTRCEYADSVKESRDRAQKLFQANFSTATQKVTDELHERQVQLEKERALLKQNRIELILDRVNQREKRQDMGKSLENDWSRSVKLKHQREDEERRFLRSAGQLLVDKLSEYRRCSQCKRRTSNCGQSNIWRDSQFLSGSQFMI